MTAIAQPSFTTGELSPSLQARVDLARYYTGLRTCRNFIVRPYGGVMNRSGSIFCLEVKDSTKKVRLVEFIVSSTQAYILEVGPLYTRFINAGAYVKVGGVPVEVATPYLEDDLALLKWVQSIDVLTICHQNYKQQQLSRLSSTSWTLTEFANAEGPFQEINVDTSKTLYASAVTGNVTVTAAEDIFTADMVGQMLYIEQAPDHVTSKWEVAKAMVVNDVRRAGSNYYQALTSGTTGTVRPETADGTERDGDPGVTWQYLHNGFGTIRITGFTSAKIVTGTVLLRLPDSVLTATQVRNVTGVTAYDPDTTPASGDEYAIVEILAHGFQTGDSVTFAAVGGSTELNGVRQVVVTDANHVRVNVEVTNVYTAGGTATRTLTAVPTYKWALEAWGGDQKYPTTTTYYQQRQIFGGTAGLPHTVWMSRSGGFLDFGRSIPEMDDDGITFAVVSEKLNEIRHFVRMKNLIALTSEAAWMITKEQGNRIPITDPQEDGGASHVRPLKIGKKAIYVEANGSAIRSLGYEFSSDAYEGMDLTMTGSHLFDGRTVVDWAYQKNPFRCVWIVLDNGALLGLTYLPDQEVIGWHRHDTDGGYFESVACIPEWNEDVVYVVVRRLIDGTWKRYIEKFASRMFTDINDAFFVDSGLTYDGRTAGAGVTFTLSGGTEWTHEESLTFTTTTNFFVGASDVGDMIVLHDADGEALRLTILGYTSAKVVTVSANRTVPAEFRAIASTGFQVARNTFTGLDHLEGETISILADGNVETQQVVANGSFALANPAIVVHAGLSIEADLETLDINVQGQSIQDRVKNVKSVTLLVEKTRGLLAGPDADHLLEYMPDMSGEYDMPVELKTGAIEMNIISDWSKGGRVLVRQSDPLPASILGAVPEVTIGG